jgi:hypothetical protein
MSCIRPVRPRSSSFCLFFGRELILEGKKIERQKFVLRCARLGDARQKRFDPRVRRGPGFVEEVNKTFHGQERRVRGGLRTKPKENRILLLSSR